MPKTRSTALRQSLPAALLLLLLPASAGAVEHEVRIYLDLDADPGTGCAVTTMAGVFEGAEQVLISRVETSSPPDAGTVTDAALAECTDDVSDTFGPPASFDGNWPVGVGNGVGGRDVVESYVPLLSLVVQAPEIVRLGLVVTDEAGGEQALLTVDGTPDGAAIVLDLRRVVEIPTLEGWGLILLALLLAASSLYWMGRRGAAVLGLALLVLATGVAWAAGSLDGVTDDWSAGDQLAANGLVLFGQRAGSALCFRVDVDLVFNQPPTISGIADVSILEDSTTGPLAFTVDDPESPASSLTVTATSSNPVLAPDGNLALGGSGANRTIEVIPSADQNGMTDVTVTVEDLDGGSASTTFRVTVTSDNDPPTISALGDQAILEDTSTGALAFTVGDVETPAGSLTVTASSDDPTVIPDGNLVLGGSGANRTITVTPAADRFGGPVTITVLVQDGDGGSVPEQLGVTVTPVNDAPSFTLAGDVTSSEDDPAQAVPNHATVISPGPNEGGQTVSFTVANDDNSLFSAQPEIDSAGTLTYTSAPNAHGSAIVTVTAVDDGGTGNGGVDSSAAQTFTITVASVNDPPVVANATISYAAVGNTLLRVPGADPEHDGGVPGRVASTSDATDAFAKADPSDVDSAGVGFQAGTFATTQGGSLTMDDDGDFHYTPPVGFTGTDDVGVAVEDTEGLTTPVTIEITVSERVWYVEDTTGAKNPVGDSDGGSTDAFETLGAVEAASGPGDYILIFETTGGLDEGIALQSGQKLYGQPVEDAVPPLLPGGLMLEEIADTDARPRIDFTSGDAVTVAATGGDLLDVEVRYLELSGSGNAVEVSSAAPHAVGVTLTDSRIAGSGAEGVDLNPGSSGAFTARIEGNVFATSSATGNAIDVTTAAGSSGSVRVAIEGNTDVTSSSGTAIHLDGSLGTGTLFVTGFADNTVHGNSGGTGVRATEVTFDADPSDADFDPVAAGVWRVGAAANPVGGAGMTLGASGMEVAGNLSFSQLDVYTGNGAGLDVAGSGLFTGSAGFLLTVAGGTVRAAGGPAVSVDPATVGLSFSSIVSTGSPTTGVSLVDVAGTLTAGAGSSLTGAAGTSFRVSGGVPAITYDGSITHGSDASRAVEIQGTTGGSATFTGPVTATDGTGILVSSNTGTTAVSFDGPVDLGTSGSRLTDGTAFRMTGNSAGTTVTASDLDVFTSGVQGMEASGDGTLDLDELSLDTLNGRSLDVSGVVSQVNADTVTCIHAGDCVTLANLAAGSSTTFEDFDLTCTGGTCFNATGAQSLEAAGPDNTISATSAKGLEIDGATTAMRLAEISTTGSSSEGVELANLGAGSTFTVTGPTTVDDAVSEGIAIRTVASTSEIVFGSIGVLNRNGTGVLVDEMDGLRLELGVTTVPNPNGAGGYGIRVEDSSAEIEVASAQIHDTVVVVAEVDGNADFIPETEGDGDGVFLIRNTGSFTLGGGTIADTGGDAIDARSQGPVVLAGLTVDNPGRHGYRGIDVTGDHRIENGSLFTRVLGTSQDAVRLINTVSAPMSLVVDDSDFTDSVPGSNAIFVSGRNAADLDLTIRNGCLFRDFGAGAITVNAGDTAASTARIDLVVRDSAFVGTTANTLTTLAGQGLEAGTLTAVIEDNTFTDVARVAGSNTGVITLNGNGTSTNRVEIRRNTISSPAMVTGYRGIQIFADNDSVYPQTIFIEGNEITDVFREGLVLDVATNGGSPVVARITGNELGTPSNPVGTDGDRRAVTLFTRRSDPDAPTASVLFHDNRAYNSSASSARQTLEITAEQDATLNLTMTDNTVENLGSAGDGRFTAFENGTLCLDLRGNAFGASGPGEIDLRDFDPPGSSFDVAQGSEAALESANGSVSATIDATVGYSASCPAPP